jgi:hypothetical protein
MSKRELMQAMREGTLKPLKTSSDDQE